MVAGVGGVLVDVCGHAVVARQLSPLSLFLTVERLRILGRGNASNGFWNLFIFLVGKHPKRCRFGCCGVFAVAILLCMYHFWKLKASVNERKGNVLCPSKDKLTQTSMSSQGVKSRNIKNFSYGVKEIGSDWY